jgi:3',5'-cyclic AMP phosphodiesterase CpdA
MRTIAHVSDLHFGREDPRAEGALLRDLAEVAPSLVAVSGDLTQRARVPEFARARDFLVRVPAPLLVVPGSHDVPLYDVVRPFARPLHRYRAWVTRDLEPVYADDELLVVGVSTASSLAFKGGRISGEQLERVRRLMSSASPGRLRVLVAHHPFASPAGAPRGPLVGRAEAALAAFGGCGLDLVLTGDLQRGSAGEVGAPRHTLSRWVLALHAGSAVSRRRRGESSSYNLVRVRGARLEVELRAFTGLRFEAVEASRFTRVAAGWVPLAPLEEEAPAGGPAGA